MVHRRSFVLAFALLLIAPFCAFAQADGSAPRDPGSVATSSPSSGIAPVAPAPTSTGSGSAAPAATSTGTSPRPTPVGSGAAPLPATPIVATSSTSAVAPVPAEAETNASGNMLFYYLGAAAFLLLGAFGMAYLLRGNQKKAGDERKCDNIKELLEEKKRELEEMVKKWPEEKLKALLTDAALSEASKDPAAKALIESARSAHEKIKKLKDAIELLQTRFDLCMLSVHMPGTGEYEGTLVENSLVDAAVLEHVQVTRGYTQGAWSVKDVAVSEKQIEKLSEHLAEGPWHMRFRKKEADTGFIVFRDHRYPITYSDQATWADAIAHGRALGIPEEMLDFSRAL